MGDEISKLVSLSDAFQSRIRRESIRVPLGIHGTLPVNVESHIDYSNKDSYSTIFADSFGPFRPRQYFQSRYKVMFILKETYLGNVAEENGFTEGHNKAEEYVDYDWKEQPQTYQNAAQMCYSLFNDIEYNKERDSKEGVLDCFWNNACIINVNKFPCIAADNKSSNDSLIYQWAQKNESLIQEEIELYRPDIIIGGHTLGHFVHCKKEGQGSIFGHDVSFVYPQDIQNLFGDNLGNNNYVYLGDILYIDSKHPSAAGGDQSQLLLAIRKHFNSRFTK